jgi:hypothetical protein
MRVHDAQLPPEQLRLKVASGKLVKAVHGTELAGEIAGMRQQRVSECTLPNCPSFFALDQVAALEAAAVGAPGWPMVTRALARHHGFELLPLPLAAPGSTDWHQSIGEISREVGEVVGEVCSALSDDNAVTAKEVRERRIIENIEEAIAKLVELQGLAQRALDSEPTSLRRVS